MGLFKCCIKQQVLLEDELRRRSHGTDARPPPEVMQQTTQTDKELLADLLEQEAREMITSGPVPPDSAKTSMDGVQDKPNPLEQSQHAHLDDTSPDRALAYCMSAREVQKLHSGPHRNAADADAQSQPPAEDESQQEGIEKAVRRVFLEYARFGARSKHAKTLDVYRFMKLIRECSLMTSPDRAAEVDLIFCKIYNGHDDGPGHNFIQEGILNGNADGQPVWIHCAHTSFMSFIDYEAAEDYLLKAARTIKLTAEAFFCTVLRQSEHVKGSRMDFQGFLVALQQIAELLGVPEADVRHAVATSRGPLVNAVTLPRFMRLHDSTSADSRPAGASAKQSEEEQVMEVGAGTYAKGMIKSGPINYGTSGFAPKAAARPGSPCFAAKAVVRKPPAPP